MMVSVEGDFGIKVIEISTLTVVLGIVKQH